MPARSTTALGALALAVVACSKFDADLGGASASSPHPTSVEPASGHVENSTPVTIHGDGFLLRTTQSGPGGTPTLDPPLDQQYHAWLDGVALEAVTWQDSNTLQATVPGGLSAGKKTLVVENAFGSRGQLGAAYEVLAGSGSALNATITATPSTVSIGQAITLTLTVTNTGSAGATNVVPSPPVLTSANGATATLATGPAPASVATLAPGASQDFTWTYNPMAAGSLTLSGAASGTDANTGAALNATPATPATVTVQAPAVLTATITSSRTIVSGTQAVTLTFRLTNGVTSAPANITVVAPSWSPVANATCGLVNQALPQTIPTNDFRDFTWTCTPSGTAGNLTLSGTASGTDANSGAALNATPASPAVVTVQSPAALTATAAITGNPNGTVSVGQQITLRLTVSNSAPAAGGASATVSSVQLNSAAAGICGAVGQSLPQTIAGGASTTFTWNCIPNAAASNLVLGATANGADVNSGTPLSASASTTVTVQTAAVVTATGITAPATVNTGQAFTLTLTLSKTGTASANVTAVTLNAAAAAICTSQNPATPVNNVGATQTFTWTCTATSAGSLSLNATASWVDVNVGTTQTTTPAIAAAVTVVGAATLTGAMSAPATVSTSQAFTLTLTFTKGGTPQANVTGVTSPAGCVNPTPATRNNVQTGQTITWSCTAPATAQTLSLTSTVSWVDANNPGTTLTFTPAPASVAVVAAATLTGAMSAPATVSTNQAFTLTLTFTKGGTPQANVTGVTSPAGCVNPTPATLTNAQTGQTITWSCTAPATAQTLSLTSTVSWVDANNPGATLTFTPAATSVTIVAGATLTGVMSAPATVSTSQAFTLTLTFTKGGTPQANVTAVTSPAGCVNPTPATRTNVQTGQTITWSCAAPATAQTLSLTSTVSWVDANNPGTTLTFTPAAASVAVVAAATLTGAMSAPATVSTSQAFTLTLTFTKGGTAQANVTAVTSPAGCVNPTPATRTNVQTGQTIIWSCTAPATAQTLSLTTTVSWADANNPGTTLSFTPAAVSVTVVAAASLSVTTFSASPTTVNTDQATTVTLTLNNTGQATANVSGVSTSIAPSANSSCTAVSPVPPQTILGGQNGTFTWTCSATQARGYTLDATVTATDANSGANAIATQPTAFGVTVQDPAALTATIARTTANGGENLTLTLHVTNAGGATATANNVTPGTPTQGGTGAASIATAPAAFSIPAGQSHDFIWTYTPTAAGNITFTVGASGTDANSGATVTAAAVTSTAVAIVPPAALSASMAATPATVSIGQTITVTLTVTNSGGTGAASATGVTPSALTLNPSNGATFVDGPSPASVATLAAGASANFTWHYTAAAAGSLTFSASATGTDAINTSAHPASNTANSPAVTVQTPAALAPTIAATASAATITVTLTLNKTGTADAVVTAVAEDSVANVTCNPVAGLPLTNPTTITWTCTAAATGTYTLNATITWHDANVGTNQTARPATGATVTVTSLTMAQALVASSGWDEAVLVASDPFGDGTPAAFVNAYQGGAWVGPSRDGQKLVRLDPSGSAAPSSAGLALRVDVGPSPASNAAWPANPPANTLGAPGCTAGTTACGPDDEAGGGVVLAGTMGGLERFALSGVSRAGSRYLYATSSSASPLDVAWVDLRAAFDAAAATGWSSALSAALFVPGAADRLYLGYAGLGSGRGPLLFALLAPPVSPGFDAIAGADVLDLAAMSMPGVASTAGVPGITALVSLQGVLYVAHDGGLVRATTATPSSAATAPGDWAQATPSAPAWGAKTSVPLPGTAGLSPRDRAVPALAAFATCGSGPCVFAARNVLGTPTQPSVVPQLWACSPTAGPAQCAPGDWSLAAPNTSGDTLLTQLGDETNGAATVLVATAKGLYLGFDNSSTGVQLYRAAVAPQGIADFRGRSGCAAGTPGCQGLGGNGFGDPTVTRVFDAKALTFGGTTSLWVTAGDGVSPVRAYRIDSSEDTATAGVTAEPGTPASPVPAAVERTARGGCSTGGTSAGTLLAALGLALLRRRLALLPPHDGPLPLRPRLPPSV